MRNKLFETALIITVVLLLLTMLTGCGKGDKGHNYTLREEIGSIERASIADVAFDGHLVKAVEILAKLDTDEAQTLARELCMIECRQVNPSEFDDESITAIFYYSDGSYEMISRRTNRYIFGDGSKFTYGFLEFEEKEFEAALKKAINN